MLQLKTIEDLREASEFVESQDVKFDLEVASKEVVKQVLENTQQEYVIQFLAMSAEKELLVDRVKELESYSEEIQKEALLHSEMAMYDKDGKYLEKGLKKGIIRQDSTEAIQITFVIRSKIQEFKRLYDVVNFRKGQIQKLKSILNEDSGNNR